MMRARADEERAKAAKRRMVLDFMVKTLIGCSCEVIQRKSGIEVYTSWVKHAREVNYILN